MISKTTLLGAAGEHYVMSQLLRRGFIAALAPQGVPNLDIVVSDIDGGMQCGLQVKSRRAAGSDGVWHMRPKHEELISPTLFYCFVDFDDTITLSPTCFIMPSSKVARVIFEVHRAWLYRPGKGGRVRKDSSVRRLLPDYSRFYAPDEPDYAEGWMEPYKENWEVLASPV